MGESKVNCIYWFRKGLRLHDNPALLAAVEDCNHFWPIFILDPWFPQNMKVGSNRWRFLVQSLVDLDKNLQNVNSRLFVVRGKPSDVFPRLVQEWGIKRLMYECDSEPYAKTRDEELDAVVQSLGVQVIKKVSNTLYNPERVITYHGKPPLTYQSFLSVLDQLPPPAKPVNPLTDLKGCVTPVQDCHEAKYGVPTLEELGVDPDTLSPCLYPGGETEALRRLEDQLQNTVWVCKFAKPETEPNSITPSTTVLSPYVKFGCLSVRTFYHKLKEIYNKSKSGYTKPPVSLHGQLLWREFFYTVGSSVPNFDQMIGNSICRQIPWNENENYLVAWANAKTGFPFIDAIMTQLRQEGWIHHLARHAVACFLTRGDLWQSWERGMKVFEELLLDADWSLNAGNWMWLSASAFFNQYFRVYSPIAFGKKTDKDGKYVKKYLPVLRRMPAEYIYEPWKAPVKLQQQVGCVIGKDYPAPIVDHDKAKAENLARMSAAYKDHKASKEEGNHKAENQDIIAQASPSKQGSKRSTKTATITQFLAKKSKR